MKFSHTLSINSNPDWDGYYIDYAALKKVINEISSEKQKLLAQHADAEGVDIDDIEAYEESLTIQLRTKFLKKIEKMVHKIRDFYDLQFNEMNDEMLRLKPILEKSYASSDALYDLGIVETTSSGGGGKEEAEAEGIPLLPGRREPKKKKSTSTSTVLQSAPVSMDRPPRRLRSRTVLTKLAEGEPSTDTSVILPPSSSYARQRSAETIRREICDLYTRYHNLKTFGELNCTGIRKILKKYDKVLNDNLKGSEHFLHLKSIMPFWKEIGDGGDGGDTGGTSTSPTSSIDIIQQNMNILIEYFAHFFCAGDLDEAVRQLNLMVRELVAFQRRSVWLDVIEDQRKHESINIIKSQPTTTMASDSGGISMISFKRIAAKKKPTKKETEYLSIDQEEEEEEGIITKKKKEFIIDKAASVADSILSFIVANLGGIICLVVFLSILSAPLSFFEDDGTAGGGQYQHYDDDEELHQVAQVKRNALAIFITASLLWAMEVFPLFVTSLLIPLCSVILRVVIIDNKRLTASETSKHLFSCMFDHVIMLLLGGFSIAAALSKYNIAQLIASYISQKCGVTVRIVLLVNIFLSTFLSMFISNVATPVLCYSLIQPILKIASASKSRAIFGTQQQRSTEIDNRLCRALILGIALGSNVGGMASPISSPQNLFAIEYMTMKTTTTTTASGGSTISSGGASSETAPSATGHSSSNEISWLSWFTISIPLCVTLNVVIWYWLCYCFELPANVESSAVKWSLQKKTTTKKSSSNGGTGDSGSNDHYYYEPLSMKQYYVVFVSCITVILWCCSTQIENYTGDMGILAMIPFVLFFGFGSSFSNKSHVGGHNHGSGGSHGSSSNGNNGGNILSKEDLNNFLWGVVLLAMGGLVLGEIVKRSGLLDVIASSIATFIEYNHLNLWTTSIIFTSLILVCTTFISHTVGAIVILPIAHAVGDKMSMVATAAAASASAGGDDQHVHYHYAKELVFVCALACSAAMGLPVSGFPNMTAISIEDNLGHRFLTTNDFIKYAIPASIFSWCIIVTLGYTLINQTIQ